MQRTNDVSALARSTAIASCILMLFVVACTSAPPQIAETQGLGEVSATATAPAPTPTATRATLDLTAAITVDEGNVAVIESLFSQDRPLDGLPLAAGSWSTNLLGDGLAFYLPSDARLVEEGLGWLHLEVDDADGTHRGTVRIIAPIAVNSPNGRIPVNLIDADTNFDGSQRLDRGDIDGPHRTASWSMFANVAAPEEQPSLRPCPHKPESVCSDGIETLGGAVFIEQLVTHRNVAQHLGEVPIWVLANAEDPEDASFVDIADEVAVSIVEFEVETEQAVPSPLSVIGLREDHVPAGQYFTRLGNVNVELELIDDVDGISLNYLNPDAFGFGASDSEAQIYALAFPGFSDVFDAAEAAGDQYSNEEFVSVLETVLVVHLLPDLVLSDMTGISYRADFPEDLGVDCALFRLPDNEGDCFETFPGWIETERGAESESVSVYFAEVGLVLFVNTGTGQNYDEVIETFQPLLDALTITDFN